MYEKAPETINVTFPVSTGVIADYNFLQTMIFDYLETKLKGKDQKCGIYHRCPHGYYGCGKESVF